MRRFSNYTAHTACARSSPTGFTTTIVISFEGDPMRADPAPGTVTDCAWRTAQATAYPRLQHLQRNHVSTLTPTSDDGPYWRPARHPVTRFAVLRLRTSLNSWCGNFRWLQNHTPLIRQDPFSSQPTVTSSADHI